MDVAYTVTALAVPVAAAAELWCARRQGIAAYRFHDTVFNLMGGLFEETMLLVFGAVLMVPYAYVQAHWAPWQAGTASPWSYLLAFVAIEFQYYWWHRCAHKVNILWAWHATHHQSSEFNLSVGLRQELVLTEWIFYLPIAVLGVEPEVFASVYILTQLYQLPVHTRVIGKLGWLEGIFNTPSSHRVHHGTEEAYIDKNFGAVLVVFDRLFGTYAAEDREPTYGLVKRWDRCDLWGSYFGYATALVRMSLMELRGLHRIRIWTASPNWLPVLVSKQPDPKAPSSSLPLLQRPVGVACLAALVLGCGLVVQVQDAAATPASYRYGMVTAVVLGCVVVTKALARLRTQADPGRGEPRRACRLDENLLESRSLSSTP